MSDSGQGEALTFIVWLNTKGKGCSTWAWANMLTIKELIEGHILSAELRAKSCVVLGMAEETLRDMQTRQRVTLL